VVHGWSMGGPWVVDGWSMGGRWVVDGWSMGILINHLWNTVRRGGRASRPKQTRHHHIYIYIQYSGCIWRVVFLGHIMVLLYLMELYQLISAPEADLRRGVWGWHPLHEKHMCFLLGWSRNLKGRRHGSLNSRARRERVLQSQRALTGAGKRCLGTDHTDLNVCYLYFWGLGMPPPCPPHDSTHF